MSLEEEQDDHNSAIVIDTGSGICKAGFAGDSVPRVIFPSIVGRPRHNDLMPKVDSEKDKIDVFVGDDARTRIGIVTLSSPLCSRRICSSWRDLEHIWHYSFYSKLRVAPERHPILLIEAVSSPKAFRERVTEIMFAEFLVPALYFCQQATLTLYASKGRVTGCVVDAGHSAVDIIPVYEGFVLTHAICQLKIGGRDITSYLAELLYERGYILSTDSEKEIIQDIKENLCYVAANYHDECESDLHPKKYEMPDGSRVTLCDERFRAPELLFGNQTNTSLGGKRIAIQESVYEAILKCEPKVQKLLIGSVVLAGGTTLISGFDARLKQDLCELSNGTFDRECVEVVALKGRQYSSWLGGSIIANLATFQHLWITRSKYEEAGASIVHKKCFF